MLTELNCIYDERQNFHNKAKTKLRGNILTLYSYDTAVVKLNIKTTTLELLELATSSNTTLRHVREFLLQNHINCMNILIDEKPLKNLSKKELERIINKKIKIKVYGD